MSMCGLNELWIRCRQPIHHRNIVYRCVKKTVLPFLFYPVTNWLITENTIAFQMFNLLKIKVRLSYLFISQYEKRQKEQSIYIKLILIMKSLKDLLGIFRRSPPPPSQQP